MKKRLLWTIFLAAVIGATVWLSITGAVRVFAESGWWAPLLLLVAPGVMAVLYLRDRRQ